MFYLKTILPNSYSAKTFSLLTRLFYSSDKRRAYKVCIQPQVEIGVRQGNNYEKSTNDFFITFDFILDISIKKGEDSVAFLDLENYQKNMEEEIKNYYSLLEEERESLAKLEDFSEEKIESFIKNVKNKQKYVVSNTDIF